MQKVKVTEASPKRRVSARWPVGRARGSSLFTPTLRMFISRWPLKTSPSGGPRCHSQTVTE
eukprot:scaffold312504_cov31-Tisochrysis_lutea.AAC.1